MSAGSYFDTLPLEVYSHVWKFFIVVDETNDYLKAEDDDLNTILSLMLSHKRAKEAFESMKGWSLYSLLLFLEQKKLRGVIHARIFGGDDANWHLRRRDRLDVTLHRAARVAMSPDDHDASTRLQDSCNSDMRKRRWDEADKGFPVWMKLGAWTNLGRIIEVDSSRHMATTRLEYRHARSGRLVERNYTVPIDDLWKIRVASYGNRIGGQRVQVIGGDYEGVEGMVLCIIRNRIYFRDCNGRILKAQERNLVRIGSDFFEEQASQL